jgi:hypothetical protein
VEKRGITWRAHVCQDCGRKFVSMQRALSAAEVEHWVDTFDPPMKDSITSSRQRVRQELSNLTISGKRASSRGTTRSKSGSGNFRLERMTSESR